MEGQSDDRSLYKGKTLWAPSDTYSFPKRGNERNCHNVKLLPERGNEINQIYPSFPKKREKNHWKLSKTISFPKGNFGGIYSKSPKGEEE